jgi:hypothetical protein
MSIVRFAMICDHCGTRSPEYTPWLTCRECGDEVCNACIVPGSADDESGKATCLRCDEDARVVVDGEELLAISREANKARESAILSIVEPFAWACTRVSYGALLNPLGAAIRGKS